MGANAQCPDPTWTRGLCREIFTGFSGDCETDTIGHWEEVLHRTHIHTHL